MARAPASRRAGEVGSYREAHPPRVALLEAVESKALAPKLRVAAAVALRDEEVARALAPRRAIAARP